MHKVVVERPRWNPGPGKYGRRANLPEELLPKFEGIKRPHSSRKGLTDLLGPLRRWLHSQLGRRWNDVYSEACAVIKPDSVVRAHIKTHLLEFVERHTFMRDRSVCVLDTWRGGGIRPVTAKRFGRSAFYVHPETGLLREIKPVSRRDRQRAQREKRQQTFRWLDDRFALKQINGIWFACQFRAIPPDGPFKAYDHALGQMVGRGGLVRRDGVYLHCIAKRQLSRRELRRFGLFNTTPIINQPQRSLQQVTAWPVDDCASALRGRVVRRSSLTATLKILLPRVNRGTETNNLSQSSSRIGNSPERSCPAHGLIQRATENRPTNGLADEVKENGGAES